MVLFPWFLLRLALAVTPTLVARAWLPLSRWENGLIGLTAIVLVLLTTFNLYPTLIPTNSPVLQTVTSALKPDQKRVQEALEFHLELYRLQPTDRDVLINLALLYRAQNQLETAESFWNQARKIDPNYGLFN